MKKLTRLAIASLILLTLLTSPLRVLAAPAKTCTNPAEPDVIYVNGVWNTTQAAASESGRQIGQAIGRPVETLWNRGNGEIDDLVEVAVSTGRLPDYLAAIFNALLLGRAPVIDTGAAAERNRLIVDQLKNRFRARIQDGKSFVVVAHSQGNLYVNQALRELNQSGANLEGVGVLNLASPDRQVAPSYQASLTSSSDSVIQPGPLSASATFTPANLSFNSGHLVTDYLDSSVVNARGVSIRDRFVDAYEAVKASVQGCTFTYEVTVVSGAMSTTGFVSDPNPGREGQFLLFCGVEGDPLDVRVVVNPRESTAVLRDSEGEFAGAYDRSTGQIAFVERFPREVVLVSPSGTVYESFGEFVLFGDSSLTGAVTLSGYSERSTAWSTDGRVATCRRPLTTQARSPLP